MQAVPAGSLRRGGAYGVSTSRGCGLNVMATGSVPVAAAPFTGHGKKRLMPQMDAVEIAYRHRGPLREVQRQRQIKRIGIAGDDHALLLPGRSGLQGHVDGFLEQIGRQRATGHKVVDEEIRGPLHAYALAFGNVGVHFGAHVLALHVGGELLHVQPGVLGGVHDGGFAVLEHVGAAGEEQVIKLPRQFRILTGGGDVVFGGEAGDAGGFQREVLEDVFDLALIFLEDLSIVPAACWQ